MRDRNHPPEPAHDAEHEAHVFQLAADRITKYIPNDANPVELAGHRRRLLARRDDFLQRRCAS